jgi:hypothetical protein
LNREARLLAVDRVAALLQRQQLFTGFEQAGLSEALRKRSMAACMPSTSRAAAREAADLIRFAIILLRPWRPCLPGLLPTARFRFSS